MLCLRDRSRKTNRSLDAQASSGSQLCTAQLSVASAAVSGTRLRDQPVELRVVHAPERELVSDYQSRGAAQTQGMGLALIAGQDGTVFLLWGAVPVAAPWDSMTPTTAGNGSTPPIDRPGWGSEQASPARRADRSNPVEASGTRDVVSPYPRSRSTKVYGARARDPDERPRNSGHSERARGIP